MSLSGHKQKLDAALEIHGFNRDVDDIDDRINEKAVAVSSDDYGKDLTGVQALQRKQEEVERDMTALQAQLEVRGYKVFSILCWSADDDQRITS